MPRAVLVLCFALAFPAGVVTDALLPGLAGVCASAPGMADRPGAGCDEADDTADALDAMLDADEPADASPPVSQAAWDLGARSRVD